MENVLTLLIYAGGILLAFRMGYKAGRQEERILAPEPDIDIPEEGEEETAPTHDEIMEDMRLSRTIMTGFNFD